MSADISSSALTGYSISYYACEKPPKSWIVNKRPPIATPIELSLQCAETTATRRVRKPFGKTPHRVHGRALNQRNVGCAMGYE